MEGKRKQDLGPARDRPGENYSPSPFWLRSRVSAAAWNMKVKPLQHQGSGPLCGSLSQWSHFSKKDHAPTPGTLAGTVPHLPLTTHPWPWVFNPHNPLSLHRLFGGKPAKQVPIATAENMKNSVVISNPHATLSQPGNLESPSGSGVLSSGSSSPLYSKNVDSTQSPLASSPSSAHSGPSNSLTWGTNASSSSAVSKDGLGFQSVSSLHTSCESIDISLGSGGALSHNSSTGLLASSKDDALTPFVRTNSVKTTLSERLVPCAWLPLPPQRRPFKSQKITLGSPEVNSPWLRDFSLITAIFPRGSQFGGGVKPGSASSYLSHCGYS